MDGRGEVSGHGAAVLALCKGRGRRASHRRPRGGLAGSDQEVEALAPRSGRSPGERGKERSRSGPGFVHHLRFVSLR
jgi:hypothetical protein